MKGWAVRCFLAMTGGFILPSFFLCASASADTVTLKNGKDLKGLVVEKHADRIILSTENKEIPILLKGIKEIHYSDSEQSFLQIGKSYETDGKLAIALAYYEKALEINPNLEEAKAAAQGVRSRFWAETTQGPKNEIEKQQLLYDAWGQGRSIDELIKKKSAKEAQALRDGLGIRLGQKGDWVRITAVDSQKDAWIAGVRKNDRLVSMDGQSMRYLNVDLIHKSFLFPRYSGFTLELERDIFLHKSSHVHSMNDFGFELKLDHPGLVVQKVKPGSAAEQAGLKDEDLFIAVNGVSTRYTLLAQVKKMIEKNSDDRVVLTIRRNALLTRK